MKAYMYTCVCMCSQICAYVHIDYAQKKIKEKKEEEEKKEPLTHFIFQSLENHFHLSLNGHW